jgi:hypothetical protein
LDRKILAVTAVLEAVVRKVPLAVRDRGDSLKMIKQTLKGLPSLFLSTTT